MTFEEWTRAYLQCDNTGAKIAGRESEIRELEAAKAEYDALASQVKVLSPSKSASQSDRMGEIYRQYGDLNQLLSQKRAELSSIQHKQEGKLMAGVMNPASQNYDSEFQSKAVYVSTESNGLWSNLTSQYGLGYDDLTYEYINGEKNGMRDKILAKSAAFGSGAEQWTVYDHMTDDEISVYNYYYATAGKDTAQKYLDSIRETLNEKSAQKSFEALEGNSAAELAYGAVAGVNQFESGIKNLFNSDAYIAPSKTQILSGMVREDLADVGPDLPDWLGGVSLGQAGYDAITTTANMAPSILVSTAVGVINPVAGKVVGSTLLGASAAGNAYQEKLNQGYTKEQAGAYGLMIGASEAVLERLLGGIGKLGGGTLTGVATEGLSKMDGVLARFAKSAGVKILLNAGSEAFEEGLQSVLEPLFWQIASGEASDVEWEEAAYSALMGFVTGGVFEAGEIAVKRIQRAQSKSNTQTPPSAETASGAKPVGESGASGLTELVDGAIAATTGAPADPLGAALESYGTQGKITNDQARDILNNTKSITQLLQQTGIKLPDTASGRRNAVKEAVAQLAERQAAQTVDTAQNSVYDNENSVDTADATGGMNDAPKQPTQALVSHGRGEGSLFETPGDTPAEIGDRPGVQSTLGENRGTLQPDSTPERQRDGITDADNASGIREQLRAKQAELDSVAPVADIRISPEFLQMDKAGKQNWVIEKLRPTGYQVERKGLGIIDFAKKRLKSAFNDFKSGSAEEVAFEALPHVLQNGIEISSRDNHKGRDYGTVTIAAPVTINGARGNMAVVVKQTTGNYYKVHRILAPDGSVLELAGIKNEAGPTPAGESPETGSLATPISSASNVNISRSDGNVNPTSSVGAAPGGFDPVSHLQYEHGTITEGENPVRPDDLPKRDANGDKVSYTARTVKGAKVTPDEFVDLLNKEVTGGALSYMPITNSATVRSAMKTIQRKGWDQALEDWRRDVRNGKGGAERAAIGALLLNNAAKAGDVATWRDILLDYRLMGTNMAQGMQALHILKTLSPSDKLYGIKRSVKQMVEDLHLNAEVTIDEGLTQKYEAAETDAQRDQILGEIQQNVADQLPGTWAERWNALRYLNMLGNFRTQIRNIVGNVSMKLLNSTKNAVATGLEAAISKISGGKLQRTKSFTVSKELLAAAKSDFENVKSIVSDGGKYSDAPGKSTDFARGVQEKRQIFKFKPAEGYRKLTNWAMEAGDIIFSKSAYARALAGYLKTNGVTGGDLSQVDTNLMEDARLYAIKEAQEVTFRDSNWLSDWVSKVGRRKDTPLLGRIVSEGTVPFRKTPANVLIRAEEYSPLGILNSLTMSAQKIASETKLADAKGAVGSFARSGEQIDGAQVINSWAKSLTGTGLFALGMLLSSLGCLSAGAGEDESEDDFQSMYGWQNYAINLPGGLNFTIDCFTPSAIPMLMGAELMQLIDEDGFELKDLEAALTSITEPMVQMSMLQGVNDTLENIRYSENSLGQLVINASLAYLTQGLTNSLVGQLERTFEDTRMTTYVDPNSSLPSWLQRTLGKVSAKIPGWDYNQIPYLNAWGEEEENPEWYINGAYNLLSPSYIETGISTEVSEELIRLNKAQGDSVFPTDHPKSITVNGEQIDFTAEQYVTYAKTKGSNSKRLVEDIISMPEYADLSDEEKADAISCAYKYATQLAKASVSDYSDKPSYIENRPEGMSEAEAILRYVTLGTTEKYTTLPIEDAVYFIDEVIAGLKAAPRETKEDGSSYTDVRGIQKMEAVVSDERLTAYVDDLLHDIMDDKLDAKYDTAIEQGYTPEQFVGGYRQYVDDAGKSEIIRYCREEMGMTAAEARKLYEIYNSKK